jgi:hypothetical protein
MRGLPIVAGSLASPCDPRTVASENQNGRDQDEQNAREHQDEAMGSRPGSKEIRAWRSQRGSQCMSAFVT